MKFKYKKLEDQFKRLDTRLQVVAYALDGYCIGNFGKEIYITSVFRTNSDMHVRYCALDFRIKRSNGAIYFTEMQVRRITQFLKAIKYDLKRPKKPTLYPHPNEDNIGLHGHLQVFPGNTQTIIDNGN